jgi:transcriptional regulator with XRE-family HTH domain
LILFDDADLVFEEDAHMYSAMKDLLKNARVNKNIGTRQLAALVNIDPAIISKFESGQRIPTEKQIIDLAIQLEIDLNTLKVAWYKQKIEHQIDFNPQSIQAIKEILKEKGIELKANSKETQIAEILSEIENLKTKLNSI